MRAERSGNKHFTKQLVFGLGNLELREKKSQQKQSKRVEEGQLRAAEEPGLAELLGVHKKEGTRLGVGVCINLEEPPRGAGSIGNHPAKTFQEVEVTVLAHDISERRDMRGRGGGTRWQQEDGKGPGERWLSGQGWPQTTPTRE